MKPQSLKRKRSMGCAVFDCSSSQYNLELWRNEFCELHKVLRSSLTCRCSEPYKLFVFPSEKKLPEKRLKWQQLINRQSPTRRNKYCKIGANHRVCSKHFVDSEPSVENPYPIINLGYDSSKKIKTILTAQSLRSQVNKKLELNCDSLPSCALQSSSATSFLPLNSTLKSTNDSIFFLSSSNFKNTEDKSYVDFSIINTSLKDLHKESLQDLHDESLQDIHDESLNDLHEKINLKKDIKQTILDSSSNDLLANDLLFENLRLRKENGYLRSKNKEFRKKANMFEKLYLKNSKDIYTLHTQVTKCICKQSVSNRILKTNSDCDFFTGVQTLAEFKSLHNIISPFVRRRWRGTLNTTPISRKFKKAPKQFGPLRKLLSEEEFLLFLMKMRLGLLNRDLAERFKVSEALISSVISSWLKASSAVLSPIVYIPDKGNIVNTRPDRFINYKNLHSIMDATEFFIETPKNPDLQKLTWSEYKHHNTIKVLVCIAPNSSIMFLSHCYGGSISDKAITNLSAYLDKVPPHSQIMVDKGFLIKKECDARHIILTMPPGRKGSEQMTPSEIVSTQKVANLRILVEQVIRRLKTFRILAGEYPINMIRCFDDVVTVCAALSNLRKTIYL
ncbi:uncharacterized protein LOC124814300 [Hydra vulgaris]|uniref:uncharacterized protein LOC124814300 n=1 Tax=Hydra vulgaris TaxID=6087 RepID=UPI001F5F01A6|nr:uncharacterized protein LOC124814300 [Hydra vulgaris]